MGTLQTQNSKSVTDKKVLSFDEISKFFSLPLSDAADALAVCRNDLKKICYENGLVRWPYRKTLSGKTAEEIKMDAARESNKELAEFLKATKERNDASAISVTSMSTGSHTQSRSITPTPEMSSPRVLSKHQGSKNLSNRIPSDLQNSNVTNSLDEFKYGFPSNGLSTASNKWWGRTRVLDSGRINDNVEDAGSSLLGKSDSGVDESRIVSEGTGLLTALRKRGFEEGKEMKLGVYRYGVPKKLGRKERVLLHGIFKSSLPSHCDTWF